MVRWEDKKQAMGDMSHDQLVKGMTPANNRAESLYDGASTSKGSESGNEESESEIGGRETAQVTYLRFAVLMVLLLAAGGVSATVYMITKHAEKQEFETKFDGVAGKVLETFEEIVSEKLAALSAFSVSTTAYARSQNAEFPFVTMNDYQQRAGSIREVVDCLLIYTIYNVEEEQRSDWEAYTHANAAWFFEDMAYQKKNGLVTGSDSGFMPFIYNFGFNETSQQFQVQYETSPAPYAPIWQTSPLFPSFPNFNVRTYSNYGPAVSTAIETGNMALGGSLTATPGGLNTSAADLDTLLYNSLLYAKTGDPTAIYDGSPMAYVATPIFDSFDSNKTTVGTVSAIMSWNTYFKGIVPPGSPPVILVLNNACSGDYSYKVDNENVDYLGQGDLHPKKYDGMGQSTDLNAVVQEKNKERSYNNLELEELGCPYHIRVYPTVEMEEENESTIPFITTFAVAAVFLFTVIVFWGYNILVERRQHLVLSQATQSTDLVSSFLPQEVQKRILHQDKNGSLGGQHVSSISRLKSFLAEGGDSGRPIADLFPFTTVLFADISGFTAWSSTRDPSHVFTLLQTVYQEFDQLAKKHKVFKVETIGDSYVAVTGLPTEQPMHAIRMARFSWDALLKMNELVKELQVSLGPDTSDLAMRFGMHSGPVTAGVLRGDRPRFQLFGDTVNTAARMESTGIRNRIQVSHTTAAEIRKLGKEKWLHKREDIVHAKGLGALETYWLVPTTEKIAFDPEASVNVHRSISAPPSGQALAEQHSRLVDWCVQVMLDKLRKIQALRQAKFLAGKTTPRSDLVYKPGPGKSMSELREMMALPPYDPKAADVLADMNHHDVEISDEVIDQLRQFISILAQAYNANHFHNFEHACHVTMATDKFLTRIMSPNMDGDIATLHEYTHGLTSDPLLVTGIVMSALVHDLDHRGCSNQQMSKEDPAMAEIYQDKSVAEQNSLDLAWGAFMRPEFAKLRQAMFNDRSDMLRFRQIIVNVVLATDIFDKELNDLRKSRWNKAFSEKAGSKDNNLRATIVIEHIIQASDVSHTMQHWHIYIKWNEKLFMEMSQAFQEGRMGKDPAEFWYTGEIGFFDNYIIPLAKKLKDCNVFGVSSDECLNYAIQNRREWEQRGREIVAGYIKSRATTNKKSGRVSFQDLKKETEEQPIAVIHQTEVEV